MSERRPPAHRSGASGSPLDAALLMLALCVGWQLWTAGPAPRPPPCVPGAEAAALHGWTLAVECSGAGGASPDWMRGPARLLFDLPIELNRADGLALQSLPGIGHSRAQAIVRARCERPFESLEDLQRVPGIGPRTVEGLKGLASAEPAVGGPGIALACPQGSRFEVDRPMSGSGPALASEVADPSAPAQPTQGVGSGEGAWRNAVDPQR